MSININLKLSKNVPVGLPGSLNYDDCLDKRSKQRTRRLLPTVELWESDIGIEHIVLIEITRE